MRLSALLENRVENSYGCASVDGRLDSVYLVNQDTPTKVQTSEWASPGNLYIEDLGLTTLQGCPTRVNGSFDASNNRLTSLEHAPREVEGDVYLDKNRLSSLEGVHRQLRHVGGKLFVHDNPIRSHVLGLLLIEGLSAVALGGGTTDDRELLAVSKIINKHLPEGRAGLTVAQNELIEAGLEEYAQV